MIENYKGYKITIEQDENADNPDEWGNEDAFLVYSHRQFQVDRKGFEPREIFDYLNYPKKPLREECKEGLGEDYEDRLEDWENNKPTNYSDYHIFTVYAYIHSGISLSLSHNGDRWDTSTTGFILVKRDAKIIDEEQAEKIAQELIDTWNQYLSGNVYWFRIDKEIKYFKVKEIDLDKLDLINDKYAPLSGIEQFKGISEEIVEYEDIDSCGGNYDSVDNILEDCKKQIDSYESK